MKVSTNEKWKSQAKNKLTLNVKIKELACNVVTTLLETQRRIGIDGTVTTLVTNASTTAINTDSTFRFSFYAFYVPPECMENAAVYREEDLVKVKLAEFIISGHIDREPDGFVKVEDGIQIRCAGKGKRLEVLSPHSSFSVNPSGGDSDFLFLNSACENGVNFIPEPPNAQRFELDYEVLDDENRVREFFEADNIRGEHIKKLSVDSIDWMADFDMSISRTKLQVTEIHQLMEKYGMTCVPETVGGDW